MPSPGKLLQQERLKREVTLATLASQTCICSRYLQAIEEDDPKILPGDFFHRSFVKQYAQALHLDQQTTDAILAEMKPIPREVTQSRRLHMLTRLPRAKGAAADSTDHPLASQWLCSQLC